MTRFFRNIICADIISNKIFGKVWNGNDENGESYCVDGESQERCKEDLVFSIMIRNILRRNFEMQEIF